MSALLSLRDVWVEYGDKIVLEKVDLDVAAGSFVSIIGPSGAGKSSLLRLILGQETPTRGSILLDGAPLPGECGPDRGVVFQRYSVFPHLTALGNTLFGLECAQAPLLARLFGKARRAAVAEATAMLEAVGLGDSLHLYPAQLSGGMQQRLAIAQALIKRPRILLLDEPSMGLSPIMVDTVFDVIREVAHEGVTLLLVEQNARLALSLCDRGCVMDGGEITLSAPAAELLDNPAVRAAYLGE